MNAYLLLYHRRTNSSCWGKTQSMYVSADVLSPCGTDRPRISGGSVGRDGEVIPAPPGSSGRVHWQLVVLEDVELLGHQAVQFRAVAIEMIQHLAHRILHRLERLVPAVQRLLPQELPEPLDQVQVGRVGRQEYQVELTMPGQPLLHHRLAVVAGVIQVQDEL